MNIIFCILDLMHRQKSDNSTYNTIWKYIVFIKGIHSSKQRCVQQALTKISYTCNTKFGEFTLSAEHASDLIQSKQQNWWLKQKSCTIKKITLKKIKSICKYFYQPWALRPFPPPSCTESRCSSQNSLSASEDNSSCGEWHDSQYQGSQGIFQVYRKRTLLVLHLQNIISYFTLIIRTLANTLNMYFASQLLWKIIVIAVF